MNVKSRALSCNKKNIVVSIGFLSLCYQSIFGLGKQFLTRSLVECGACLFLTSIIFDIMDMLHKI
jgi:hypothetical protein